jgi:hypothetical protein
MGNKALPLMAASVIGIIGLMTMSANFWVGGAITCLAIVFAAFSALNKKPNQPVFMEMVIPNEQADARAMDHFLEDKPDRDQVNRLMYILGQAGLDPRAVILADDNGAPVLKVKDLLVEMVRIAGDKGTYDALQMDITNIYGRIEPNIGSALEQFRELDVIKTYLARKAMVDIEVPLTPSRFNLDE